MLTGEAGEAGGISLEYSVGTPLDLEILKRKLAGLFQSLLGNASTSDLKSLKKVIKIKGLHTQLVYVNSQQMILMVFNWKCRCPPPKSIHNHTI